MKKLKLFLLLLIFLQSSNNLLMAKDYNSIYDFNFIDIDGNLVDLSSFSGKPILIVNTASRCGFTYQYEGLQELFSLYKDSGLTIIAVTSNSFNQEFNDPADIKKICLVNYNIGFITSSPIAIVGENSHPIFAWIKEEYNKSPRWNFYKYLFDKSGKLIDSWSSLTKPNSQKIIKKINQLI